MGTSGLIRPSSVGPWDEKKATVSRISSVIVSLKVPSNPATLAPTVKMLLAVPGGATVPDAPHSPSLPAANTMRKSRWVYMKSSEK